jgi:hypothetical protein
MKLASPKNDNFHNGNIDKKEVVRDKLFSPEEDSQGYGFGKRTDEEGIKTKSDWNINYAKPGVDVSEFYNPNAVDDMDTQNQQTPLRLNFENYNSKAGEIKWKIDLDQEDEKEPRSVVVMMNKRGSMSNKRNKSPKTALSKKEKVDRSERNRVKDKPSPVVNINYNDFPHVVYNPRIMGIRNNTLSEEESDSSEDVDQNEVWVLLFKL